MTPSRIAGVIHLLFAAVIVAALVVFPTFRFVLAIVVPLAVLYVLTGYWLLRGTLRRRVLAAVPAVMILFFVINQLPGSLRLIREGDRPGSVVALDLAINGGLLLLNGYVLYALYGSRDRSRFQR